MRLPRHDVLAWVDAQGAAVAAVALLRPIALVLAGYLLATTLLAVGARLVGDARAVAAVERLAPAVVAQLARRATAGAALLAVATTQAPVAAATARTEITTRPDPAKGPITMRELPPEAAPNAPPTPTGTAATWTIASGEHLWFVARHTLESTWGRRPTDREVDPYWRALIERNRDRLPDRDLPDLVVPGLVVELPEVPAPPTFPTADR